MGGRDLEEQTWVVSWQQDREQGGGNHPKSSQETFRKSFRQFYSFSCEYSENCQIQIACNLVPLIQGLEH